MTKGINPIAAQAPQPPFADFVPPTELDNLLRNLMNRTGAKDPEKAVELVNSGTWGFVEMIQPRWRAEGHIIHLYVHTNGLTGPEWIGRLDMKGVNLGDYAENILNSKAFKPLVAGKAIKISIVRNVLCEDFEREIDVATQWAEGALLKTRDLTPEIACLIRDSFTDADLQAMGIDSLVVMHDPVNGCRLEITLKNGLHTCSIGNSKGNAGFARSGYAFIA